MPVKQLSQRDTKERAQPSGQHLKDEDQKRNQYQDRDCCLKVCCYLLQKPSGIDRDHQNVAGIGGYEQGQTEEDD